MSARVVRCRVKSHNERNPYPMLQLLRRLPRFNGEEGGDDFQSSCPLCPGLHRRYNGYYNGLPNREVELIPSKIVSVQIAGCNSPA